MKRARVRFNETSEESKLKAQFLVVANADTRKNHERDQVSVNCGLKWLQ